MYMYSIHEISKVTVLFGTMRTLIGISKVFNIFKCNRNPSCRIQEKNPGRCC